MKKTYPYKFNPAESGILVEIFLPKRSDYQGTLYQTLTEGFSLDFKKHFLNPQNMSKIKKMIASYRDLADYDEQEIERFATEFSPIFNGYSLYEVDGVFASMRPGRKTYEERTQIIRVIFLPDYQKIAQKFNITYKEAVLIGRKFLRHAQVDMEEFKASYENLDAEFLSKTNVEVLHYLEDWVDAVAFFMFGYLIFEICEKLLELQRIYNPDNTVPIEEEIWTSAIWGYSVNRVKFLPGMEEGH